MLTCVRCARHVRVCSTCERGQRYCGQACSQAQRRDEQRAASADFQRTRRGAHLHATRMQRLRDRGRERGDKSSAPIVTQQSATQVADSPISDSSSKALQCSDVTAEEGRTHVPTLALHAASNAAADKTAGDALGERSTQSPIRHDTLPSPSPAHVIGRRQSLGRPPAASCCSFCGRRLPRLTRLDALRRRAVACRKLAGSIPKSCTKAAESAASTASVIFAMCAVSKGDPRDQQRARGRDSPSLSRGEMEDWDHRVGAPRAPHDGAARARSNRDRAEAHLPTSSPGRSLCSIPRPNAHQVPTPMCQSPFPNGPRARISGCSRSLPSRRRATASTTPGRSILASAHAPWRAGPSRLGELRHSFELAQPYVASLHLSWCSRGRGRSFSASHSVPPCPVFCADMWMPSPSLAASRGSCSTTI